jgi:multiple sugar transport system substrate-binding protein
MAAALLVIVGLSTACNQDGGSSDEGPVRLVLFGDPTETAGYEDLVRAFEAENPDVDVALSPVAEQDDLLAKLTTQFASGRPPDVFLVNYRNYGQFASSGVLAPVQPFLDQSVVIHEDDFAPAALDAFRFDGDALTCMPQNVSSLVTYYNVDLFEEAGVPLPRPGWTWDDFLSAALALTGGGSYGVGTEVSLIRVAPFVWSAGGEVVDDPESPAALTLDSGPAREGLDFFLDLQTVHQVAPPDREEQSQDSEARFLAGTLGMYLNSRKSVPTLRTIDDFTWDVAQLPVAPGGVPATILHGDAYCLADTDRTADAWRFVEFANSEQGQQILARSGRTVPSRTDVASSEAFLRPEVPPASAEVFLDVLPDIRAVPHTATWSRVEKEADSILEELFYGRVGRDEGIDLLVRSTEPLFAGPGQ